MNSKAYKIKSFFLVYSQRFLCKKTLLLAILYFLLIHIYLAPIKSFSILAHCKVSPWSYPFLISDANFLMLFMAGVIYYYSNVPFMQRWNSYYLLREGKARWIMEQIKYIFVSAYSLTIGSIVLSWLAMIPRLAFETNWGRVIHTIARTNAGNSQGLFLKLSAQYMSKHTASETMFVTIVVGLGISFLGILMLFISIWFSKTGGVLIASIVVVYSSVVANVTDSIKKGLSMWSPISWMQITQMDVTVSGYKKMPDLPYVLVLFSILIIILSIFIWWRVMKMDFVWDHEEE